MKILRSRSVALLLAGAFGLAMPSVANAADQSVQSTSSYSTRCAYGQVQAIGAYGYIKADHKNSATILEKVSTGAVRACVKNSYTLGDRYSGCGVTNANGWLSVWTSDGRLGYAAMTCWADHL